MTFEKLNRYIIKSQLGQGGMATVYHAYDPSFERDVAIKVLPEAMLQDPQFRTRFTREAKAIARLEHPAIVPVYDVGEENNQPFIVMRYMSGGSLADMIKQGPISLEKSALILNRLAPSLDAAHVQGIVHRDIKPANILFDQYGNSFLSDFGIARMGQSEGPTLTGNFILGTPAYMSPEQARGETNLDGRSDIYSLGATLFEMLSGRVPYEADTPMGQAIMHIMEPTPNILELRPDLSYAVQDVIARSMEKDRNLRFATAAEMAQALNGLVDTSIAPILRPSSEASSTPENLPSTELLGTEPDTQAGLRSEEQAIAASPISQALPRKRNNTALIVIGLLVVGFFVVIGIFVIPRLMGPASAVPGVQETPTSTADENLGVSELSPTETPLPTETSKPTLAPVPEEPTPTVVPTEIPPTETPDSTGEINPVPGQTSQVAYLIDKNIILANLDGSDSVQLTQDSTEKYNLQWTPDGRKLMFISGNCLREIEPESKVVSDIVCFKYAKSFKDFAVTPDSAKIALSLNNQLFIVPFDLEKLQEATTNQKLTEIAECKELAPYEKNSVKGMEWSLDGNTLAIHIIGVLADGRQGEIVQIIPVDQCIPNPKPLDNFPPPRFDIPEYEDNPTIQRLSWDGIGLFALTSYVRNDVYGNLYFYNSETRQGWQGNPIDGKCCYTDPVWSPDGNYLFFTFQDLSQGAASQNLFYYVLYADIEANAEFIPVNIPAITDPRANPEPAIRLVP
jgi:serine/threonine protein kinase